MKFGKKFRLVDVPEKNKLKMGVNKIEVQIMCIDIRIMVFSMHR